MTLTTFAGLSTGIANWLDRADLTDRIPEFIELFEARMNRVLRVPEMEEISTSNISTATAALPADFLEARNIYLATDPRQLLQQVSLSELNGVYGNWTAGRPMAYAISNSAFLFGPAPDATYSMVLDYYQKIPALTGAATTNWLSLSHPDIYLRGCLLEAEAFGWNDERLPMIKAALDEALAELMAHGNRKRHGGPVRIRSSVRE